MREEAKMQLLRRTPLFAGLADEDLQLLAADAGRVRYRRGQIVFAEGDSGDFLLLVVTGRLKVITRTGEGDEFLLAVLHAGDTLGEVALVDGGRRSATVEALEDVDALRLDRQQVQELMAARPIVSRQLLVAFAQVVRRLTGVATDLVFLDLPRRLAKLLLELRDTAGQDVLDVALTQRELASHIGATRQTVNHALRDFEKRGWITTSGRTVCLRDRDALRRFAGS